MKKKTEIIYRRKTNRHIAQGEYGEFIEYTSHFPEETHDILNDLTPCPRHILIDTECKWNAEHPSGEPPSVKLGSRPWNSRKMCSTLS